MLGRKKAPVEPVAPPRPERPGAKNRPTPKRSAQEAARRRPLVQTDRKAASKAAREQMRAERIKTREALHSGDEEGLPPRDKGAGKRFARDFVDARRNVGEYFLIAALVLVAMSLSGQPTLQLVFTFALWAIVLLCVLDAFWLSRQLRAALLAKFGPEGLAGGTVRYGVMRAFQIRRTRLPKPQVGRGQYPS